MSQTTIHTSISKGKISQAILSIPQGMTGTSGTTSDQRESLIKLGNALLGKIREAFITKSTGGTDEAGDRWVPLSPKTVQARMRQHQSGTKTKKRLSKKDLEEGDSPARRRIKSIIRGKPRILVNTGKLLESLSPNSKSKYQILDVATGSVIIGTSYPGAMTHHHGSYSKNIPQRRLWPPINKWPDSWWKEIKDKLKDMVIDTLIDNLRSS